MPRPERALDQEATELTELASRLRELRSGSGLTYRQLSERTNYSAATLSRAAGGNILPSWEAVQALTRELAGDPREMYSLWLRAAEASRGLPSSDPRKDSTEESQSVKNQSIAEVIGSLSQVETATVLLGDILFVKSNGQLVVQELDRRVRNRLMHSEKLREPGETLRYVEELAISLGVDGARKLVDRET